MVRYKTIYESAFKSFEEKKSEFIGYVKPCNSEEEAIEYISEINKKHSDATHNCYAYIIGENSLTQRYSDDGEPQGTAGIPILEVLKKEELTNIVCVVTRYFGGKKLGASGLIRAYTKGCTIALDNATKVEMKDFYEVKVDINYAVLGVFDNWLGSSTHFEFNRLYEDTVKIYLYVDKDNFDKLKSELMNMTSGNVIIDIENQLILPVSNGILYRGKNVRS